MVTVIIKSVEQATNEMNINKIKKEKLELEQENAREQRREKEVEIVCNYVNKLINTAILNGEHSISKTIYRSDGFWLNICDYEVQKRVSQIFRKAGYRVSFTEYSKSWQKRSGKYCFISVFWSIEGE